MSTLRRSLLTDEHLTLYVEEFRRELRQFERRRSEAEGTAEKRIMQIEAELANLTKNMLAGVIGPGLQVALSKRERLRNGMRPTGFAAFTETPPSSGELRKQFERQVDRLTEELGSPEAATKRLTRSIN